MPPSPNNLRQKTVAGIGWSFVSRFGSFGLQFIIGILLARLLPPEAFGLIAMVVVFTGFANLFVDLGFGAALIQHQDVTARHYDSIFWLNTGVGLLLALLFAGAAPLLATFYDEPLLLPLTVLLSSNFLIGSLGLVHGIRFKKTLNFRRLAYIDISALALSGTVGIAMALSGQGVWSLAVQSVLSTACTTCLLWLVADWRPSLRMSWEDMRELLGFSSHLLGFNALNYWFRNADDLLVGRVLGSSALGFYSRAYSIMLLPLRTISRTIGQVMFPALSMIQHDRPRVARIYLRTTRTIALMTFPSMIGLLAVTDSFVIGLLGQPWAPMIPILQLFCLVGLVQSILTLNGNLYQSQGRTDLQLKVGGAVGVLGVVVIVAALPWGVVGVAIAYTAYALLITYPSLRIAVSLVGLTFTDMVRNLAAVFGCAAAMGLLVWTAGQLLPSDWPHWALLVLQIPLGAILYGVFLQVFRVSAFMDLKAVYFEQWRRRTNTQSITLSNGSGGDN